MCPQALWWRALQQEGRHCGGIGAESLNLEVQPRGKRRESLLKMVQTFESSNPPQCHTSSNKVTPSILYLTVLRIGEPTFKYMSIWGHSHLIQNISLALQSTKKDLDIPDLGFKILQACKTQFGIQNHALVHMVVLDLGPKVHFLLCWDLMLGVWR